MGEMITVTDSAVDKIKALITEEQNPDRVDLERH